MFKKKLDFANLCLHNELDEISCCFIFCDVWELFLCQHETSKIKNTIVRNSFSTVYAACNITHTIEKPIAALSVSSENFFSVAFTWKSTINCVLVRLYPLLPKTALLTAQSSFTKSNDGTVTAQHVPFATEMGGVKVLRPFNSISVISRRWNGEHERLCAMKCRLGSRRISPPVGFEPATPWTEVGSAIAREKRLISLTSV